MKKIRSKQVIVLFFILCLFGIAAFLLVWKNQSQQITPTPSLYTDPGNHFSVKVPVGWDAKTNTGTQTTGLHTSNPQTQNIELTQIYAPNGVGVRLQIYDSEPSCAEREKSTTVIDGLPASYNAQQHTWTIFTTTAILVIQYYYPGSGNFHNKFGILPTLPPQSVIEDDKRTINDIVTSLRFNSFKPLVCL